jgi:hypothetical protein
MLCRKLTPNSKKLPSALLYERELNHALEIIIVEARDIVPHKSVACKVCVRSFQSYHGLKAGLLISSPSARGGLLGDWRSSFL